MYSQASIFLTIRLGKARIPLPSAISEPGLFMEVKAAAKDIVPCSAELAPANYTASGSLMTLVFAGSV